MKIFINVLLIFLFSIGVYGQYNPDFNPKGMKVGTSGPGVVTDGMITASWTTVATSPNALSRSAVAYVKINGTGFVYQFGGGSDAALKSVIRYNTGNNTWETSGFASIPTGMSAATAIPVGDSVIFLFGGEIFSGVGKTYKYNVITNTWTVRANMPTPVTDAGVVKYSDNLIYVIGGGMGVYNDTGYTSAVQLYNISSNSYSTATAFKIKAGMMGAGIWKDTIICAGGFTGSGVIDSVYKGIINRNNTSQITWTALTRYPLGPTSRMAAAVVRKGSGVGILFTGGAVNGVSPTSYSYIWDLISTKWSQVPYLPLARANMKAASFDDSLAYVVAGFTSLGIGTGQTDVFNVTGFEGVAGPIGAFNLQVPSAGTTFTTVPGSIDPIAFTWDAAGVGAQYKFTFTSGGQNKIVINTPYNLIKIASGDFDTILAKLNIPQGDEISGQWDVMAYKGPGAPGEIDSIKSSNGPRNVTFKRYRPVLSAFNLIAPVNNITVVTSQLNNYPVNFVWTSAGVGANYRWFFAKGNFDTIKFRIPSANKGIDSMISFKNNELDSMLAQIGIKRGDTLSGQWRVYAYSRTDSLASAQSYNIKFVRAALNLNPFRLVSPPDNTVITVSQIGTINFGWTASAVGANYKFQLSSNNFSSLKIELASGNNGYDTNIVLQTADLESLLGIAPGDSLKAKWRVYSYKGNDSLVSLDIFNITFKSNTKRQLLQGFTSSFPPTGWNVEFTGLNRWSKSNVGGYMGTDSGSAKFDFYDAPKGTIQSLITNVFPNSKAGNQQGADTLFFDYSHAYFSDDNVDSLIIYYSTNSGVSYDRVTDAAYGSNSVPFQSLSTTTYQSGPFTPTTAAQWGTKRFSLPANTNRIKFQVVSGWGNNLYLDNIKLKNRPPICILPGDYSIDDERNPTLTWDSTTVPSFYRLQLSLDSNFAYDSLIVKDTVLFDKARYYVWNPLPVGKTYTWRVKTYNDAGESRYSIKPFHFYVDSTYKLNQSFAGNVFPPVAWKVDYTGTSYWTRDTVSGSGDNFSAKFDFYTAPAGSVQSLNTNTFPRLPNIDTLIFNYAHAYVGVTKIDSLFIYYSINTGKTWVKLDSAFGSNPIPGKSLSTASQQSGPFIPNSSQWGIKYIKVPISANKIQFKVQSGNGNNLYIDNIRFKNASNVVLMAEPPAKFELKSNYPNPFNPSTTISFSIPKNVFTKLKVYDILGREVKTLVNEFMTAGEYRVVFNGDRLASGTYLYRLEAGDFVDVKKMLLIK